ncbi:MAG: DinB family protein [Janthinobacterium lividum]
MQAIADQLDSLVDEVYALLTPERIRDWHVKPTLAHWSKAEVLGHLADSALNNLTRFVRGTYESDFALIYSQNEWVRAQRYQQTPVPATAELWRLLNQQLAQVLRYYPAERRAARCNVGQQSPVWATMEAIAHDYLAHLRHHLRQMELPIAD